MSEEIKDDGLEMTDESGEPSAVISQSTTEDALTETVNLPAGQVSPTSDINTSEIKPMEVHHHPQLHHNPKPWKEYILEYIMIVLAVATGFFAESLRENIGNNEKEKQTIESLVKCLASDTVQLKSIIHSNAKIVNNLDSLAQLKNADLSLAENRRKFYERSVIGFTEDWYFKTNDAALQQLKFSGLLRLIKKQNIIDSILEYDLKNKGTLAQENDCYFIFKESLLDLKKVITFSFFRDPDQAEYYVTDQFLEIKFKNMDDLPISSDKDKLTNVFNDASLLSVSTDAYIEHGLD